MPPAPAAFADALVLTGPTGSGKSAVALAVADRLGCEILALDSMTVYRGMSIGTAKPSVGDRQRVPHHLLDLLDPWESGNVGWWLVHAAAAAAEVRSRGRRPLFVGGTPFYLKALLSGLFDGPPADPAVRADLEREADRLGPAGLHARLAAVDPVAAGRLHPNDVRRVVRALEVFQLTGRPLSAFQQTWDTPSIPNPTAPPAPALPAVVLEWPRAELVRWIDARVDAMLAEGWLAEVHQLRELPRPLSPEAAQALGYKELLAHLDGDGTAWADVVARIKTRTRQFSKRQQTWFRHLPGLVPCPADAPDVADRVATALEIRAGSQPS